MRSFWMGLLVAAAVVGVVAVGSSIWLIWRIDQETVTSLVVTNPGGSAGKAFVVHQPGLSAFPEQVTTAFVSGLAAAGWQVSTTTASDQAPLPNAAYDLIVFAAPVYFEAPAKPLARYIARVGNLGGKPVVILLTGATDVTGAITATEKMVAAAKGRPVRSLGLTTMKASDEQKKYTGSNVDTARQVGHEVGQKFSLAAR